jgi:hypothetical protein
MYSTQDPEVGSWYVNRNGKLVKVRLAVYRHEYLSALLLEYLDGQHQIISINDWYCLELHRDMVSASDRHALK